MKKNDSPTTSCKEKIAIIGAGPAGLTAAYQLSMHGYQPMVLEADPTYVGGMSRTASVRNFNFDIGGHRFFSKSKEVENLWTSLLPDDMVRRHRKSRIFFNEEFLSYPLKPLDAFKALGPVEAALCAVSYVESRLKPIPNASNFEAAIVNSFGRRLYNHFFKSYTEKVWGMPCSEISADWAQQRIKGLSLKAVFENALASSIAKKRKNTESLENDRVVTTLIDSFRYPRKGAGMLWEAAAEKTVRNGGTICMDSRVSRLQYTGNKWQIYCEDAQSKKTVYEADIVISSAPLSETIKSIASVIPESVLAAAESLRYRDFFTVALLVKDRCQIDDHWIYIQDPGTVVGRIQNFKAWSPEMISDPTLNCFGLEYFCNEGDALWNDSDSNLIALAAREMQALGLVSQNDIQDAVVVRMPKAYPVYDSEYLSNVKTIRTYLQTNYPTLHMVGRNGMHRYNNQDHSMVTAMLTVKNILLGRNRYNPWLVNEDAEYIEKGSTRQSSIYSGYSFKREDAFG